MIDESIGPTSGSLYFRGKSPFQQGLINMKGKDTLSTEANKCAGETFPFSKGYK